MFRRSLLFGFLTLTFACVIGSGYATAQEGVSPSKQAQEVEARVWSPYCPGRLLIDCTTHQARELRADIRERIEGGDSQDEVLAWIRSNYGDEALAEPGDSGIGLLVWMGPLAFFVAGAILLAVLVRRWSRATTSTTQGGEHAGS
ncbi:MAG: cytochrome c-type biogenesis protein CcmH [Actinomycetota bacterium]